MNLSGYGKDIGVKVFDNLRIEIIIGQTVEQGKIGIINNLLPGMTRFPSGRQTSGAEIALGNNEKVLVPLANIEVLG